MNQQFNKGLLLTSLGSFWWGFIGVIYFQYVSFIGHIELIVHRCLWTAVMLIFTTSILSKWNLFKDIFKNKKTLFADRYFISDTLTFAPALQAEIICKPSLSVAIIFAKYFLSIS